MRKSNRVIDMQSIKEVKQCLGCNTKQAMSKLNKYECMIQQMLKESGAEFQKKLDMLLNK